MTTTPHKAATQRPERTRVDKFSSRRTMLAQSALATLAERGFAHTGLREIAQHSTLSHGALHYYFSDKDDLIAEAVWSFKSACARRYDEIVTTATSEAELRTRIADTMATTLRDEAPLHRLWYDLRNQALFERGFSDTIVRIDELLQNMVWAIVQRQAELTGGEPTLEPGLAYALVDGLFQNELIRFLRGDAGAVERLRRNCAALLSGVVALPAQASIG